MTKKAPDVDAFLVQARKAPKLRGDKSHNQHESIEKVVAAMSRAMPAEPVVRPSLRAGSDIEGDSMRTARNEKKLSVSEFLNSDPELSLKLAKGHHENLERAGLNVGMSLDATKEYIDTVSSRGCCWETIFLHTYIQITHSQHVLRSKKH